MIDKHVPCRQKTFTNVHNVCQLAESEAKEVSSWFRDFTQ